MPNTFFLGTWDPGSDLSSEQTEFATAHRVPFLDSPYPRWNYVSGIVVSDLWRGIAPTDEEVEVIAEVLTDYQDYFFPKPNPFRDAMKEFAPYDIDGGANLAYFIKRADGAWAYRKRTWTDEYTFRPGFREPVMALEEVLKQGRLHWRR